MSGTTRMSSKGQVVIPQRMRAQLGLRPGMRLRCEVRDDTVVLSAESPTSRSPEFVTDPATGLRIRGRTPGREPVTAELVRSILDELP